MTTTTIPIRRATAADIATVANLIATAFHHLPVCEWLVPSPVERVQILPADFAILIAHALTHGTVDIAVNDAGVAVWLDRTRPIPDPPDYHQRVAAACRSHTERFHRLDELFDTHHPTAAHHHLAFLAVHPDQQSRGIGSALLTAHHKGLDRHATGAYLEASSLRARALYQRHGYDDLGPPFAVPNGAQFWPMWRPATLAPQQPAPAQPEPAQP